MARRQVNMYDEAWDKEGVEVLEKFDSKMMISGYSEYHRRIIVTEGLART